MPGGHRLGVVVGYHPADILDGNALFSSIDGGGVGPELNILRCGVLCFPACRTGKKSAECTFCKPFLDDVPDWERGTSRSLELDKAETQLPPPPLLPDGSGDGCVFIPSAYPSSMTIFIIQLSP